VGFQAKESGLPKKERKDEKSRTKREEKLNTGDIAILISSSRSRGVRRRQSGHLVDIALPVEQEFDRDDSSNEKKHDQSAGSQVAPPQLLIDERSRSHLVEIGELETHPFVEITEEQRAKNSAKDDEASAANRSSDLGINGARTGAREGKADAKKQASDDIGAISTHHSKAQSTGTLKAEKKRVSKPTSKRQRTESTRKANLGDTQANSVVFQDGDDEHSHDSGRYQPSQESG
jgi:hypothetical protein